MKISEFFERIYILNLPERKDRYRAIIRELIRYGMPLTSGRIEIFPAMKPCDADGFPSREVRGCFLGHLNILKKARDDRLTKVLVMEDDLAISPRILTDQEAIVNQLKKENWGFVYFGHIVDSAKIYPITLKPFSGGLMTASFYGINGPIFDRLISFLEEIMKRPAGHPDGGPMHIDGAYSTFRAHNPDIVTLIACPQLGWQRSSPGNINPKWFDRMPILSKLAIPARLLKEYFIRKKY